MARCHSRDWPPAPFAVSGFCAAKIRDMNPQRSGKLRCAKNIAQSLVDREVMSHSCDWLKSGSENGGYIIAQ